MMELIRKLRTRFYEFFDQNYPFVMFICFMMVLFTGYLHYEFIVNKNDLIYWKHVTMVNTRDLDYYHIILLTCAALANLLFMAIVLLVYLRPMTENANTDLTLLEIKDRYVRFIMLRLIARLDKIQLKLNNKQMLIASKTANSSRGRPKQSKATGKNTNGNSNNSNSNSNMNDFMPMLRTYMRAHESMSKAVALFRKDARKVLAPSETEIMLPIEDIFCVCEDEERELKRAGYYKIPIEYSDEIMKALLNPKEAE